MKTKMKRVLSIMLVLSLCLSIGTVVSAKKKRAKAAIFFKNYTTESARVFKVYMPSWWWEGDDLDEDGEKDTLVLKKVTCRTDIDTYTTKNSGKKERLIELSFPTKPGYKTMEIDFDLQSTGFEGDTTVAGFYFKAYFRDSENEYHVKTFAIPKGGF